MNEWLTRGAAWLALSLYVGDQAAPTFSRGHRSRVLSRWLSSFGCATFGIHVVCAFQFYHNWSHAAAYAETARQTSEWTGWKWGGGLYINYRSHWSGWARCLGRGEFVQL